MQSVVAMPVPKSMRPRSILCAFRRAFLWVFLSGAAVVGIRVITLAARAADRGPPAELGTPRAHAARPVHLTHLDLAHLDRTGRKRVGVASFYARKFAGRKMADGTPMRPHGDNAASKTLPLGTTAKVTNLETGRSAIVTIRDRGPYIKDRIVDLSPSTAQKIGIDRKQGVARVEVTPIAVPP